MLPSRCIERTATRGAGDEAELQQIGFHHILDCIAWFRQTGG